MQEHILIKWYIYTFGFDHSNHYIMEWQIQKRLPSYEIGMIWILYLRLAYYTISCILWCIYMRVWLHYHFLSNFNNARAIIELTRNWGLWDLRKLKTSKLGRKLFRGMRYSLETNADDIYSTSYSPRDFNFKLRRK